MSGEELSGAVPAEPEHVRITTAEQAIAYVEGLLATMLHWRGQCDVVFPESRELTATYQRRALWTFLHHQGALTGALQALLHVGILPVRAFQELNQKAVNSLIPSVISRV